MKRASIWGVRPSFPVASFAMGLNVDACGSSGSSDGGSRRWKAWHARRVRLKRECRVEVRVMVRDWRGVSFVLGAAINLRHHICLLKSSKFSVQFDSQFQVSFQAVKRPVEAYP